MITTEVSDALEKVLPALANSFNESKKKCTYLTIEGHQVAVIGLEDLVRNKKAVNRPIDRSDIQALEKQRKFPRIGDDQ